MYCRLKSLSTDVSKVRSASIIRDWGSTYLWNVSRQWFYTAVHPRRQFWTSHPYFVFINLLGDRIAKLDCRMDNQGSVSIMGRICFFHRNSQFGSKAHILSYLMSTDAFFSEVRRLERERDYSPDLLLMFKNTWSITYIPFIHPIGVVDICTSLVI
jgi:hypothetical protein